MHSFDYRFLADNIPSDLASVTNLVYDLRGRNALRASVDECTFSSLRDAAIIESVRGSNAIEGIVTTRARLTELMQDNAAPTTPGEHEIVGYRRALDEIFAPGFSADLTQDYICHLHELLLRETSDQAGAYKRTNNWIQERDASGKLSVRFVPVSAEDTPEAMQQLVMAYHEASHDSKINSLALTACVVVDFLCIHPFADGNGRVSRLLTNMLLQQSGFNIGRYVSVEGMINEYRAGYYDALKASSEGWHENKSDYAPFILFLLQILYACYKELDQRYVEGTLEKVPKSQRVEAVLLSAYTPVSKEEVCDRLPDVGVSTVERVLSRMVKEGSIEKIGTYRDARYRRL